MNFGFFQQANKTFLTPDEQQVCDGLLTKTECEEALKSMNADKTPGTEGLQPNFTELFRTSLLIYSLPSILFPNLAACPLLTEGVSLNLIQKRA